MRRLGVGGWGIDGDRLGFALSADGQHPGQIAKGPQPSPLKAEEAWLLALIGEQPDLTLEEIRDRLAGERDVVTGLSSIWRFFHRHGVSFKKTVQAAEQERADIAAARQRWKAELQPHFNPKKLVFIDETGTSTNMARQRGRCRRGARLIGRVPHGHWKVTTWRPPKTS